MNAIVEQLLAGEGRTAGQADIILEAATWAAASFSKFRQEDVVAILQAASAAAGRQEDFSTPRVSADKKLQKVPHPLGVVFAAIPENGPVAAIISTLSAALATRNTIVIALHPGASAASIHAARAIAAAVEEAGAPACTIQVIEAASPTLADQFAKSAKVSKCLDTAVTAEALVTWTEVAVDGAAGATDTPSPHPVLGRAAPMSLGKLQEGASR